MNLNRLGSLLVKLLPVGLLIMLFPASLFSVSFNKYVVDKPTDGAFPLIVNGQVVPIVASQSDEAGVKRFPLHSLHNRTPDDIASGATYFSLMRRNLANLRQGLGCAP